jgi:hypothetical protein
LPAGLDELVLACLAKSPANRPSSAAALRRALGELDALPRWTAAEADDWWATTARRAIALVRAKHAAHLQTPGPQTLAIDWAARNAATLEA